MKVPDALPKAIAPEDVRALLSVIDNTRNRALVLMLLRTGMRIGEPLSLRVQDIDLKEQKVFIHEARKTGVGRVVYFSADAKEALVAWLKKKDPREDVLAYGKKYESITYAAARLMFVRCLKKAGLLHKGYTLHCLRHTFASELLNAGMRLECLQPLLGHTSVEVTRRYARLTDKTITSMTALQKDLEATRQRGYSIDDEESMLGAFCVGVPILNAGGRPVAAVSISGPTVRFHHAHLAASSAALLAAAEEIRAKLGLRNAQ